MADNKARILHLLHFLEQYTDEDNGVTLERISDYLAGIGIKVERKTLYNDIGILKNCGYDILCEKDKQFTYRLLSRTFELAELKLLADTVSASRFITNKKSRELVKKLESLTSSFKAKELHRQTSVVNVTKTENERIYYSIDAIHRAIEENRRLTFKYFDYDVHRQKVLRHGGELYEVDPISLVYCDENYYLVAFSIKNKDKRNYRIDCMEMVTVAEQERELDDEYLNVSQTELTGMQFSMYGGNRYTVEMSFDNSLVRNVNDRFGSSVSFIPDGKCFTVVTDVEVSRTFFSWIFQFGGKAKIVSPPDVIEQYHKMLAESLDSLDEK